MSHRDVFHTGEIAVQLCAGERAIAAGRASIIRDRLNAAAIAFVRSQRLVAIAAVAPGGALWASLWHGAPGYIDVTRDGDRLELRYDRDEYSTDPVRPFVWPNEPLGLLVIDLATRRRLRINGVVDRVDGAGFGLSILETFGNCPKYIQQRVATDAPGASPHDAATVQQGRTLDDERRRLIARCDTLFVASVHGERGIDASHRGGPPGFARVIGDHTVRIPDYPGNSMFQTLGNFELDARCGLAFVDFERRRILATTGHAALEFGDEDATHPTGGTGRYWSCTIEQWVEFPLAGATRWTLVEPSPFNPA